jgi:hypothetical protein
MDQETISKITEYFRMLSSNDPLVIQNNAGYAEQLFELGYEDTIATAHSIAERNRDNEH